MVSAASLIPELKAGKSLIRHWPGDGSLVNHLWMTHEWEDDLPKGGVTLAKYYGEGEWKYKSVTFEEIATWTDDGEWELDRAYPEAAQEGA